MPHLFRDSSVTLAKRKRLGGGGRHLTFKELDEELARTVREMRSKKLRVSRRIIMMKAEKLFNPEDGEGDFKASRGWLERFLVRHNFRLRVPTSKCQKPPSNYASVLAKFVVYLSELRKKER